MSHQIEELLWKFKFVKSLTQSRKNDFFNEFVNEFVEANGYLCGGATEMGMYDPKGVIGAEGLKRELIAYLRKRDDIAAIVISEIDSNFEEIETEEILFLPND